MTPEEIVERLVVAAEVHEAASRTRVGPQHAKSLDLGYAHTWADRNGWGEQRNKEESEEVWKSILRRPTASMISEAEEATAWLKLVENDKDRAALAAWCRCAASKSLYFKDWCRKQEITPKTGRSRKNRAIFEIYAKVSRSMAQNCESVDIEGFPIPPENGHIEPNIEDERADERGVTSWASDEAFTSYFSNDPADFSWSDRRNERRRQREAKKRKQEAA